VFAISVKYDSGSEQWIKIKSMLKQREKHGMVAFEGE